MPTPADRALLQRMADDDALTAPAAWRARAEALEWLDATWPPGDAGRPGYARAWSLQAKLEAVDEGLHRRVRAAIRAGRGPQLFRQLAADLVAAPAGEGYDALDALCAGILRLRDPGAALEPLAQDMVFYQPTPARHVLDLLARLGLGPDDELVDLGAGLGHVPMLAAICTGARAQGVELQPAFVDCAARAARALGLHRVRLVARDARLADLSTGTVFYLYTPFRGALLHTVLDALRTQASRRPIRVCTFGPCTATVAAEPWLRAVGPVATDRVAVFHA